MRRGLPFYQMIRACETLLFHTLRIFKSATGKKVFPWLFDLSYVKLGLLNKSSSNLMKIEYDMSNLVSSDHLEAKSPNPNDKEFFMSPPFCKRPKNGLTRS